MQAENHRAPRHPELSLVALAREVAADEGRLPAGTVGTVVHVYRAGRAYEVEFQQPFHTVAIVEAEAITE